MTLEDTKCIEDVRRKGEVNDYLALGWVLTGQYVVDRGELGAPSGEPHFILAWQQSGKEPQYPEHCEKREIEQYAQAGKF